MCHNKLIYVLWFVLKIVFDVTCDNLTKKPDRIVGGQNANQANWQFIVSVQITRRHRCGGSLISPIHVITAAHCMTNGNGTRYSTVGFSIIAGTANLNWKDGIRVNAKTIIIYPLYICPRYKPIGAENDLALIELEKPVKSRFVKTIEIMKEKVNSGIECLTAGWGNTLPNRNMWIRNTNVTTNETKEPQMSLQHTRGTAVLQEVPLPITDEKECEEAYGLTWTVVCTLVSEGGKDACQGDSGGPLVCNSLLTGLTSFGYGCARPEVPAVFTNVSHYRDWIERIVTNKSEVTDLGYGAGTQDVPYYPWLASRGASVWKFQGYGRIFHIGPYYESVLTVWMKHFFNSCNQVLILLLSFIFLLRK